MAYEKQTWACDDLITADKLNHMEQGIEDAQGGVTVAPLRVNLTRNISEANCENHIFTDTDKTYMEIGTALVGGKKRGFHRAER